MARRRRRYPSTIPSFLPHPDHPGAAPEATEYHAVRLALLLRTAVDKCDLFTDSYNCLSPSISRELLDWLRRQLAPLDCCSPTVARIRRITDDQRHDRLWDDPEGLRYIIERLRADIRICARRARCARQCQASRG